MSEITVYYDSTGSILIELDGAALELTRGEAEQLFVDLGFVLQDLDVQQENEDQNDS